MRQLAADLRYAVRALRHSPGFTAVAALTLALGIGANTAIFSVVRGVLLKPLPHREGDRLIYLRHSADGPGRENINFSVPEVRDFRTGVSSLRSVAEYSSWSTILLGDDDAMRINIGLVTGNFFEVMGLSLVLGRPTGPGDDGPGVPPVMVLTHEFWMKRFGGDSSIVGKQVRMSGGLVTVIGVVQPAPTFPNRYDALLNMVYSPHHLSASMVEERTHRMTEVVARLAPGATVSQAKAEVATAYARMQREFGKSYDPGSHMRVTVIPFKDVMGERARLTLWLLMGAAAFVLIIAAANVTNLTLMRGVRREPELVLRTALGAGAARLRRLLLAENLLLTLLGAALGVVLAVFGVDLLTSLAARYSPRAGEIRLDGLVLGFTLALSLALALLLSFAATLPQEGALATWLSASAHRSSSGMRKQRLQSGLVVAQIAVSIILLAGAGLLTRTMIQLSNASTGLETEEVLTMQLTMLTTRAAQGDSNAVADAQNRYGQLRLDLSAQPGVLEVGYGSALLRRSDARFDFKAEGRTLAVGEATPNADMREASPEYFRAAGIPLLRGRPFSTTDRPFFSSKSRPDPQFGFGLRRRSGAVVILNQTLADQLFRGEDPIGRRVAMTGELLRVSRASGEWRTVVGVVGNIQDGGPDGAPGSVVYFPDAAPAPDGGTLVIRVQRGAEDLIPAATRIVRQYAPRALIEKVRTVTQIKHEGVAHRRLNAQLISLFGILALVIAAVGIAGVLAFSVSARTREIGIRMSLGADRSRVQRMILGEGGVLLALGLVLGLAGALLATRVIRGLLFGVAPDDPLTFAAVTALMVAIGLLACWIPALRASRIDPAVTMRSE
jgi:putative ABC transport system permease protein